jgi:hypothetical protein
MHTQTGEMGGPRNPDHAGRYDGVGDGEFDQRTGSGFSVPQMIRNIANCETPMHRNTAILALVTVGALAFKFMS